MHTFNMRQERYRAESNTTTHSGVSLTSSSFYIHVARLLCPGTRADVFGDRIDESLVRGCGGLPRSFGEMKTFAGGHLTSTPNLLDAIRTARWGLTGSSYRNRQCVLSKCWWDPAYRLMCLMDNQQGFPRNESTYASSASCGGPVLTGFK